MRPLLAVLMRSVAGLLMKKTGPPIRRVQKHLFK